MKKRAPVTRRHFLPTLKEPASFEKRTAAEIMCGTRSARYTRDLRKVTCPMCRKDLVDLGVAPIWRRSYAPNV